VMRTYTHLQDKNIIINRRGIGFFVSDKANEIVKDIVKKQFVTAELPLLFKTMEMLKLTIHEVSEYYNNWKLNLKDNQS
ncbi:MAG: GntR family transcriptional regulator, partial [Bacteroidota bacterium]|nr:GntR family transcriptional regulator [Bacteroidota bacterium]